MERDEGKTVLDEVTEVIDLPRFKYYRGSPNANAISLPDEAEEQLRKYVAAVSNAYHSNPFHCLQHASQVTTAVTKLLSRVVATSLDELEKVEEDEDDSAEFDPEAEADELSESMGESLSKASKALAKSAKRSSPKRKLKPRK